MLCPNRSLLLDNEIFLLKLTASKSSISEIYPSIPFDASFWIYFVRDHHAPISLLHNLYFWIKFSVFIFSGMQNKTTSKKTNTNYIHQIEDSMETSFYFLRFCCLGTKFFVLPKFLSINERTYLFINTLFLYAYILENDIAYFSIQCKIKALFINWNIRVHNKTYRFDNYVISILKICFISIIKEILSQ